MKLGKDCIFQLSIPKIMPARQYGSTSEDCYTVHKVLKLLYEETITAKNI